MKKIRPIKMLSTRDSLQDERYKKTESERMEKVFDTNENKKKVGVAILISDKSDFITKTVTRDKEVNYIMIKLHNDKMIDQKRYREFLVEFLVVSSWGFHC